LSLTRLLASCFDDHPSLLVLLHSSRRVLTRCLYPEAARASAYLGATLAHSLLSAVRYTPLPLAARPYH
jgi:hypothetical protein